MHGDGPCQAYRKLAISADFLLFDLLLFLVICVFNVAPYLTFYIVIFAILGAYVDNSVFFVAESDNGTEGTIYPSLVFIVADKKDCLLYTSDAADEL